MAVVNMFSGSSFIFCIVLIQLLITSIPEYEALAMEAGKDKSKRILNPKKSSKMSPDKMKALTESMKVFHGQNTQVPSLVMLMESSPYYLWEYYSVGLIMSDTCVLIRAYDIADTYNDPPTLYTDYYHTIFIPRYGCDVQHHVREFVFSDPPYNYYTQENDIALAMVRRVRDGVSQKQVQITHVDYCDRSSSVGTHPQIIESHLIRIATKRKIQFGNAACGGQPVAPTWVSCDKQGPPPNYTDCYWASYGLKTGEEPYWVSAPEEISPNANKIKILSYQECDRSRIETEENVPFLPDTEICGQIPDGSNPYCPYDRNGALFCKYWNPTESHNSVGWGRMEAPPRTNSGGWSEPKPKGSNYVAVGHLTYYYGDYCPQRSAALFTKFGSESYRSLFKTDGCGFKCSSDLKPGEKCKGNPSPSLGPVYCIPESSGGWGGGSHQTGNNGSGDTEIPLPNGWEETSHQPSSGWVAPSHQNSSGWGASPHQTSSGWGSPSHEPSSGWGASSHPSTSGWKSE